MSAPGTAASPRILVVRLGAMGDIVHALPAVSTLKADCPAAHITWAVEPQWTYLLEGNPSVDRVLQLRRRSPAGLSASLGDLRSAAYDIAVDFQGLLKSALVTLASKAESVYGFDPAQIRERPAAVFYTKKVPSDSVHIVDRNLDLAAAVAHGESARLHEFPLPPGEPEGELPERFILASPLAGWTSKQWPMENYGYLGELVQREWGIPLVLNGAPGAALPGMESVRTNFSGIPGLIYATRRAEAVVGVDSGPMHLAAALAKPGVAIFGPTDPTRNGPFGDTLRVLRSPSAITTYKRRPEIDESMTSISPADVLEALRSVLPRAVAE